MQHDSKLTAHWPSFVTHLECAMTGERHQADQVHNPSRAGKPLLVRYDLAGVAKALSKEKLAARARSMALPRAAAGARSGKHRQSGRGDASGLKYPLPPVHRTLDRHQPINYAEL